MQLKSVCDFSPYKSHAVIIDTNDIEQFWKSKIKMRP